MSNVISMKPFICCENDSDCMFPCSAHPWRISGGIEPCPMPDSMMLSNEYWDRREKVRYTNGIIRTFVIMLLFYGLFALAYCSRANAMDHGFDLTQPISQWMESLLRPDKPRPAKQGDLAFRCCGKGDAYEIVIDEDAIGDDDDNEHPEQLGTAHISRAGAEVRKYPDGTIRDLLPEGLMFHFPKSQVNPPADGNPTGTAWAFLSVRSGTPNSIGGIYCVVPLPPGY